ncbi:hypothetical protein [Fischerella sp. PCC 9605]|uniref:hypothetical protein n=1 Tax=Fischerella sp. PCC 9605 TaxID=1173024 RepID=UPI00047B923D|nr:hypothetical protein [Fischerella sp. PCC 9605]
MIDPDWMGRVNFYELVFGTFLSYFFLVLMWEQFFNTKFEEWRYIIITFLGASFFLVNHYFQNAPFYLWLICGYSLVFFILYYIIGVIPMQGSFLKKALATLSSIVFTIAFILFENIARLGVDNYGINEFWFMLIAYFGYLLIILWRGEVFKPRFQQNKEL